jgi:hypothetical protein
LFGFLCYQVSEEKERENEPRDRWCKGRIVPGRYKLNLGTSYRFLDEKNQS